MTNRERILAILDGKSPDRIPWIPRLQIWQTAHAKQGTLPQRFEGLSLEDLEIELGMGASARLGQILAFDRRGDVEVAREREGASTVTTYRTPVGTVSTRHLTSEEHERMGIEHLEVEHMIKGPEDFGVVEYMVANTYYTGTPERYLAYEAAIGDNGVPLAYAGDCPFHDFLLVLAGYQTGYYLLFERPDLVEHLIGMVEEVERERLWPVVAESPARLILHGLHLGSDMTPPDFFGKYITPYYRDFSELLHAKGKKLSMHADNDTRYILGEIRDAGFDMAETFTTAPQVPCTLEEARTAWGTDVIIWGGVPSVLLEDTYTDEDFEAYMRNVFRTVAPGDAFILGVADNVMPGARLDRLERITEMVEEWGHYPIEQDKIG